MGCPSDTDVKRLTRFLKYDRFNKLSKAGGKPVGDAFVLAGPEASEIGCLQHLLEMPAQRCHFVDSEETSGLEIVKEKWKGANTFNGNIEDALRAFRGDFALVDLDFCGYLRQDVLNCLRTVSNRVAFRGFVAYTFIRNRESAVTPSWDRAVKIATAMLSNHPKFRELNKNSSEWLDAVRFFGYTGILQEELGADFVPIFQMRYSSHTHSNMGVIAFQNMPRHLRTPAWRTARMKMVSAEEKTGIVSDVGIKNRLKNIAMELSDTIPSKFVADVLHMPRTVVAAWQAHKTRGTYHKEEEQEEQIEEL